MRRRPDDMISGCAGDVCVLFQVMKRRSAALRLFHQLVRSHLDQQRAAPAVLKRSYRPAIVTRRDFH